MQKSNVLIVDDAPINRELLAYILQDRYQVFQAENGKQAIEMIESRERIYRLVLLDIQMPVLDGFGFLDYMKKKDLLRNLPVIVISGDSSDASILYAYKLGAVDFFSKPFSPEIVLNRVHQHSNRCKHTGIKHVNPGVFLDFLVNNNVVMPGRLHAADISGAIEPRFRVAHIKAPNHSLVFDVSQPLALGKCQLGLVNDCKLVLFHRGHILPCKLSIMADLADIKTRVSPFPKHFYRLRRVH